MCRFLMIKSKKPAQIMSILGDFAQMCKENIEWQGDGWGVAWKEEGAAQRALPGGWKIEKSLKPIWEDINRFNDIPASTLTIIHARGASFPSQKGDIGYNQPYADDNLCFVFNGELYGVSINAEGKIGAQKIFSLVKKNLDKDNPKQTLTKIQDLLIKNSKGILGLNIGYVLNNAFFISCYFGDDSKKDYYTVRYFKDGSQTIVCSEKISNYPWRSMEKGEIIGL